MCVSGKTTYRTLPLIASIPYVKEWLNVHPFTNNQEAPIFISISRKNFGDRFYNIHSAGQIFACKSSSFICSPTYGMILWCCFTICTQKIRNVSFATLALLFRVTLTVISMRRERYAFVGWKKCLRTMVLWKTKRKQQDINSTKCIC